MSELNLNDLYLDDNSFSVVPEGDYHFTVDSVDIGYSTSDKYSADTQVVTVHMSVPYADDVASIRKDFYVASKMLWLIRQLCECVGIMPEKGRFKFNPDDLVGKTGVFRLVQGVSAKGNEYNSVDIFYRPSEAPTVCDNDDVWSKQPTIDEAVDPEVNPFV